jgi:hypothetical protein
MVTERERVVSQTRHSAVVKKVGCRLEEEGIKGARLPGYQQSLSRIIMHEQGGGVTYDTRNADKKCK